MGYWFEKPWTLGDFARITRAQESEAIRVGLEALGIGLRAIGRAVSA